MLAKSGLTITPAEDLTDAARKVVALRQERLKGMSILIDKNTQGDLPGLHRQAGHVPLRAGLAYGTKLVGGITPGRGGKTHLGQPVFNTVDEAVRATGATVSMIYVPAPFAADAILEAADAGRRAGGVHHRGHSGE